MNISAVLLFIAFFAQPVKGIRSSCTSIEVKEGDTVNLKFHFDGDIKTPQLDINIVIKLNSTAVWRLAASDLSFHSSCSPRSRLAMSEPKLSIEVGYFGNELHVNVNPNRSEVKVYANETNALTLEIRKVTKQYSGNCSAFVHGSDKSEVEPCTLTVIESLGKSGVGSHDSAVIPSCAISTLISTLFLILIFE